MPRDRTVGRVVGHLGAVVAVLAGAILAYQALMRERIGGSRSEMISGAGPPTYGQSGPSLLAPFWLSFVPAALFLAVGTASALVAHRTDSPRFWTWRVILLLVGGALAGSALVAAPTGWLWPYDTLLLVVGLALYVPALVPLVTGRFSGGDDGTAALGSRS